MTSKGLEGLRNRCISHYGLGGLGIVAFKLADQLRNKRTIEIADSALLSGFGLFIPASASLGLDRGARCGEARHRMWGWGLCGVETEI